MAVRRNNAIRAVVALGLVRRPYIAAAATHAAASVATAFISMPRALIGHACERHARCLPSAGFFVVAVPADEAVLHRPWRRNSTPRSLI